MAGTHGELGRRLSPEDKEHCTEADQQSLPLPHCGPQVSHKTRGLQPCEWAVSQRCPVARCCACRPGEGSRAQKQVVDTALDVKVQGQVKVCLTSGSPFVTNMVGMEDPLQESQMGSPYLHTAEFGSWPHLYLQELRKLKRQRARLCVHHLSSNCKHLDSSTGVCLL